MHRRSIHERWSPSKASSTNASKYSHTHPAINRWEQYKKINTYSLPSEPLVGPDNPVPSQPMVSSTMAHHAATTWCVWTSHVSAYSRTRTKWNVRPIMGRWSVPDMGWAKKNAKIHIYLCALASRKLIVLYCGPGRGRPIKKHEILCINVCV
jgi:hypothetical protein